MFYNGRTGRVTFVGTHDLCVRCIKGYSVVVLTGTDAQIVRPYTGYTSRFDTTDAQIVRPYTGYTSRFDTTDARSCVPTAVTRHARRVSAFLYL